MAGSVTNLAGAAPPAVAAEYYAAYRTPRFRWWHSLLALGLFAASWGAGVFAVTIVAVAYELATGASVSELSTGPQTPALFLANNVGVALAIPAAVAAHYILFRQPAGWLFSVQGRVRWNLLARSAVVAAAVHVVLVGGWLAFIGPPANLGVRPETWFLLAAVVLTIPLQAAGEEVAFRGLTGRAVAAWFSNPRTGITVATASTTGAFALVHGFHGVGPLLFYLTLGVAASVLTWRTGGLEAAVALHVMVSLTTWLFVPFLGLANSAEPEHPGLQTVAQVVGIIATNATLLWQIRRTGERSGEDRAPRRVA